MFANRVERAYGKLSPAVWLILIVAVGVALRILMWSHAWGSDDTNYAHDAWRASFDFFGPMAEGAKHNHHSLRKGLLLPTALMYRLFGVSDWTTGAWSFVCSIGLIVVAHRFARRIFSSEPAGLVAAVLMAAFPLDIIFASVLWPTEPQAFLAALGMYLFFRAEDTASDGRPPAARDYFLGGACIGLAYLVHITALFLGLFFAAYIVVYWRRFRWQILLVAVGVVAVIFAEQLAFYIYHQEWLYSFRVTNESQNLGAGFGYIRNWEGTSLLIEGTAWASFVAGPWSMALLNQEFALYYVVGLPAMIYVAIKARQPWAMRPLLLWFVTQFLWIAYGSTNPAKWVWLGRMPRYYSPVTLPLMLVLTYVVVKLWQRGRHRMSAGLTVGLLVSGLMGAGMDDGINTLPIGDFVQRVRADTSVRWGTDHTSFSVGRYYNAFEPLTSVVLATTPPSKSGFYKNAKVQPFSLEGVDRFFYHPENWDFAVRQPENCGAADKSGKIQGACRSDELLKTLRTWGEPEVIAYPPRRWFCIPLRWALDVVSSRLGQVVCDPKPHLIFTRPATTDPS